MDDLKLKKIPDSAKRLICVMLVLFLILGTVAAFVIHHHANTPISLTFFLQNGEDPVELEIKKGEVPENVPVPKKTGALFVGWYLDRARTISADVSYPFDKEASLYAAYAELESYWRDEEKVYYLSDCPSHTELYIISELSASSLQNGVALMDETEGVSVPFAIVPSGAKYVLKPANPYADGHTYSVSLPDGAAFADTSEDIDILHFGIEKEKTLQLIYAEEIIEIPESNPSSETTLHAFTTSQAEKNDIVLVGGRDKLLYLVSDVVSAENGKYLLLSPIGEEALFSADVYELFTVSLTDGTLASVEKNELWTRENADRVTYRLEQLINDEALGGAKLVYEDEKLKLFLYTYEKSYAEDGINGDVILAVYTDVVEKDGKSYSVSYSVATFADIGLSLLYTKRENSDVIYDVSLSLDSVSVSSLKIESDQGKEHASTVFADDTENIASTVSEKIAALLKHRTEKAVSSMEYSFGEGAPVLSLEARFDIDIGLFDFEQESSFICKQATSERFGVIGNANEQRSYHRISSLAAECESTSSPNATASSGLSFEISMAYPNAYRPMLSMHAQSIRSAESFGSLQLSTSAEKSPAGEGTLELSSYGIVYPANDIELADFNKTVTLALGERFFLADTKPKDSAVTVLGDSFDASDIALVPIGALNHSGQTVLFAPDRDDITLYLRGERASSFVYDRERMTYSLKDKLSEDTVLYLDIYYPLASYTDGEVTLCKRTVKIEWKAEAPSQTVEATFYSKGELLAKLSVPKGSAPGYAGMNAERFSGYVADSFASLWDRDPFLPIFSDTSYELTAKPAVCPIAFVYYYDGLWYTSFDGAFCNETPDIPSEAVGTPFWTVISPYDEGIVTKNSTVPKISSSLAKYCYSSYIAPEFCESEDMSTALKNAWERGALCIYVADYGNAKINVDYISGTESESVQYKKNALREGLHSMLFSHRAPVLYGKGFAGWTPQMLSGGHATCTAEYTATEFLLTVTDENGVVVSQKKYPMGIIPSEYGTLPQKGNKIGVWLNSAFGNLVSWYDIEENRMISRDVVLTPYFGRTCTVIVDANGGEADGDALPEALTVLPGEIDFASILPALTKKTDLENSYEFLGWGRVTVDKDITISAEYKETPHIYRVILDAVDGWLGEETRIEYTCTYSELQALRQALLSEQKPQKLPTPSTLYTFKEWKQTETNELYTELYTAQYSAEDRYYTVKLSLPDGGLFSDGTAEKEISVKYGDAFEDLENVKYSARVPSEAETILILDGWTYNGQRIPAGSDLIVRGDMTLVAVYKEIENVVYEIVFSAGDGTFSGGAKTVTIKGRWGDPVKAPKAPIQPSLEGHTVTYRGWNEEIPVIFTENRSISAVFDITKNQYTVIYYSYTGEIYETYKVTYGDRIPVPEPPALNGGTFIKWIGLPADGKMIASDLTITPKYDIRDFYVIYYVDGKEHKREVVTPEESIPALYPPTKPGYVFDGWQYPTKTMPYADVEVHGSFKKATYQVRYWKDGETFLVVPAEYESLVELTALPTGADAWYTTDVLLSDGSFRMPIGDVNLYCETNRQTHKVTYKIGDDVLKTETLRLGQKLTPPDVPAGSQYTGKWVYYYDADYTTILDERGEYRFGDVAVTDFMLGYDLIAVPEQKWTNTELGKDINQNGVDDGMDLVITARDYALSFPKYDGRFIFIGGYPTDNTGVCTDVIWRAYFGIGVCFKDLVDADIEAAVKEDENPYDEDTVPESSNINFRRVRNLKVYFTRNAHVLTNETTDPNDWQPGDIVAFSPSHIGICSDKRDSEGFPLIIHHTFSRGAIESDELGSINAGNYTVVGHYRLK